MLCILTALLLSTSEAPTEQHLYLTDLEVSTTDDLDAAEWKSVSQGADADAEEWRVARVRFELPDEPERGRWLLRVGSAGLAVDAVLNEIELPLRRDLHSDDPRLASGPTFEVSSDLLIAGSNTLLLHIGAGGRYLATGPLYLLSPGAATRLRRLLDRESGLLGAGNLAILASCHRDGRMAQHVVGRSHGEGGAFRLLGNIDVTIENARGEEISLHEMEHLRGALAVPAPVTILTDARLPGLQTSFSLYSPIDPVDPVPGRTPVLFGEFSTPTVDRSQAMTRYVFRLRLFPASGGPLETVEFGGFTLVHNGRVGLFAANAEVIGTPDQPQGLRLEQRPPEGREGLRQTQTPLVSHFGVLALDASATTEQLRQLVRTAMPMREKTNRWVRTLGNMLTQGPPDGLAEPPAVTVRKALGHWLPYQRILDTAAAIDLGRGVHGHESYWAGELQLMHFPAEESRLIDWLLATQDEQGFVRATLPAGAAALTQVEADSYSVLRATRLFFWAWDGDALAPRLPSLRRALEHARGLLQGEGGLAAAAGAIDPAGHLSPSMVVLACVAAHRSLAEVHVQLGQKQAAAELRQQADEMQATLTREAWNPAGYFQLAPEEDPTLQAAALLLDPLPVEQRAAMGNWLVAHAPEPEGGLDFAQALCVRALLHEARVEQGRPLFRRYTNWLSNANRPLEGAAAAYYGTLVFGLLGVQHPAFGMLQFYPRFHDSVEIATSILLPEGLANLRLSTPDVQRWRNVSVRNNGELPLQVLLGVPGGLGTGEKDQLGSCVWSRYDIDIEGQSSWDERIR